MQATTYLCVVTVCPLEIGSEDALVFCQASVSMLSRKRAAFHSGVEMIEALGSL